MARKRVWLALFLCLIPLTLPGPSEAQGSPTLVDLDISLWPEYDRPGVLVIYRGQFDPAASYPLPIEIAIPAAAGPPTAVAYVGQGGGTFNLAYTTRVEGDLLFIVADLPTSGLQIEYYEALLAAASGVREHTFTYTASYPVASLALDVQEPPTSQGFELTPAADSVSVAGDGLRYHQVAAGALAPGESLSWTFRYTKADDRLTTSFFQATSPAPAPTQPAAAASSRSTVAIFVIGFVGLVGVGLAAYWLGQRTQPPAPATARRRQANSRADFCHQCGAEIRDDSHFCHRCGAAVRREP